MEVLVEKIYANKKDPKSPNKTLMLREEIEKVGGNNILSQFLVGGAPNVEKRVAFQTMHESLIEKFGVKEGIDLNEVLDQPIRLVVEEVSQSEYEDRVANGSVNTHIGFKAKINPETKEYLVNSDGEYIFRRTIVGSEEQADTYMSHVGSVEAEPSVNAISAEESLTA